MPAGWCSATRTAIGPTPTSMRSSSLGAMACRDRAAALRLSQRHPNKIDCVVTSEDAVRPW